MRSGRASGCQCQNRSFPGFDSSNHRNNGIWGTADEAVSNKVLWKSKKIPLFTSILSQDKIKYQSCKEKFNFRYWSFTFFYHRRAYLFKYRQFLIVSYTMSFSYENKYEICIVSVEGNKWFWFFNLDFLILIQSLLCDDILAAWGVRGKLGPHRSVGEAVLCSQGVHIKPQNQDGEPLKRRAGG